MRKRNFLIIFVLIILLLIVVKILNKEDSNMNYVKIVDNQELVIENILPLSDEVGSNFSRSNAKSNIYYNFKIKSDVDKKTHYKILLDTHMGKNFIEDKYIKILLSDEDDNLFKEYKTDSVKVVTGLDLYNDKYLVHSGTLKKNGEEQFILRMWVSDAATYDDKLIFDGKLSVYSY